MKNAVAGRYMFKPENLRRINNLLKFLLPFFFFLYFLVLNK